MTAAPDNDRPESEDEEHVFDIDFEQEVIPVTYDITSYGADYPVDGLVKRLNQGDIVVPSFEPAYDGTDEVRSFQRKFVWSRTQMDRFIESLLLGLPVPGIFLVRTSENILLVLDGQQRLRTLQSYYHGIHLGREYRLKNVDPQFAGRMYAELDDEDRRRLDDSIIHATILRQENPSHSQDSIYSIFERLNTGGSPLQPQEIRVALYHGPFLKLISQLNENESWRLLYGPASARFKDQELILRVLAMFEIPDRYSRPLKGFLNYYLGENQFRNAEDSAGLAKLFLDACATIAEAIGPRVFRPVRALNAAVLEAIMVAVMRRLQRGPVTNARALSKAYDELIKGTAFQGATTSSTSAEDSVDTRLRLATEAFGPVQ